MIITFGTYSHNKYGDTFNRTKALFIKWNFAGKIKEYQYNALQGWLNSGEDLRKTGSVHTLQRIFNMFVSVKLLKAVALRIFS